jgi:hypothetical protein
MSELKFAVVAGGLGGLVLTLVLRERGIDFELYEQAGGAARDWGRGCAVAERHALAAAARGRRAGRSGLSRPIGAGYIRRWDGGAVIAAVVTAVGGAGELASGTAAG